MLPLPAGREASLGVAASVYERHRPERTLLYQLVEDHYPALKAHLAAQGTALPGYVEREFDEYLKMRAPRARFSAGLVRDLSRRAPRGVQLQTPWFLRQLRCQAHGRECGVAGG